MDNIHNKTSDDILAVLSLSMYQQTLRNKSVEELRYIAEGIFNIDNASFYNKEELIVEIVKARAKMLEPKKKKNKKRRKKESIRRINRRGFKISLLFLYI